MQKLRNRSSGISDIRFSRLPTALEAYSAENTVNGRFEIWVCTLEPTVALNIFGNHVRMDH